MTLSEQLSVRLTTRQREYIRKQAEDKRGEPGSGRVCEADVVRACIQHVIECDRAELRLDGDEA